MGVEVASRGLCTIEIEEGESRRCDGEEGREGTRGEDVHGRKPDSRV